MQQQNNNTSLRPCVQLADNSGEDDFAYFAARPAAKSRIRTAFDGEVPADLLPQARGRQAVVIVAIQRNTAGNPVTRGRAFHFIDGGTA